MRSKPKRLVEQDFQFLFVSYIKWLLCYGPLLIRRKADASDWGKVLYFSRYKVVWGQITGNRRRFHSRRSWVVVSRGSGCDSARLKQPAACHHGTIHHLRPLVSTLMWNCEWTRWSQSQKASTNRSLVPAGYIL